MSTIKDYMRPVIQMDLEGNFIKEYPSVKAAAKQFGGSQKTYSKLHYAVRYYTQTGSKKKNGEGYEYINKNNEAFGFTWKFK